MKNIRNILIVCVCLLAPLCAAANPTVNIKFADDSCLTFEGAGSKQIDVRVVSGQAIANLSLELELRRYDENAKLGAEPVAKAESTQDVQGGGGLAPISVDIEVPAAGFYRLIVTATDGDGNFRGKKTVLLAAFPKG